MCANSAKTFSFVISKFLLFSLAFLTYSCKICRFYMFDI